jgi:hypothetical protein
MAAAAKRKSADEDIRGWPVEWLKILAPEEVETESTLHWDTVKRHYPHLIIKLSSRRVGMRRGHALMLGKT